MRNTKNAFSSLLFTLCLTAGLTLWGQSARAAQIEDSLTAASEESIVSEESTESNEPIRHETGATTESVSAGEEDLVGAATESVSDEEEDLIGASGSSSSMIWGVNPMYEGLIDPTEAKQHQEEVLSSEDEALVRATDGETYTSVAAAGEALRKVMLTRSTEPTNLNVQVSTDAAGTKSLGTFAVKVISAALSMPSSGNDTISKSGDYLRYIYATYSSGWTYSGSQLRKGVIKGTFSFTFTYNDSHAEDAAVQDEINRIMTRLKVSSMSSQDAKFKAIYEYIAKNVDYYYGDENPKIFTPYPALCGEKKEVVCQGYALLLYRMLWQAGVPNRIVTGTAGGGAHAWNIVQLGSSWYNVDSTWDAIYNGGRYKYCLLNAANFSDHVRDSKYSASSFTSQYPVSSTNYPRLTLSTSKVALNKSRQSESVSVNCFLPASTSDHVAWSCSAGTIASIASSSSDTGNTITAKQDGNITVTAKGGGETKVINVAVTGMGSASQSTTGFNDVPEGKWYTNPVKWAVARKITSGTAPGYFSPNADCTRGQIVTFLWKANGSPTPKTWATFSDVSAKKYYYTAVSWAVEKKITSGIGNNQFGPNNKCTREQAMTFLWKAAGQPVSNASVSFTDVSSKKYYYPAVRWAVDQGITKGLSDTQFGVGKVCSRAQIVTFLYNTYAK